MELERGMWRGKWLVNGEWVVGWKVIRQEVIGADRMTYIFCYEVNPDGKYEFQPYEVDPSTLGEWTGKNDKNGEPIFEGDIIQPNGYELCWPALVEFIQTSFGFSYAPYGECGFEDPLGCYSDNELEKLGNKWDNPDLLGVE
jgi:hypothetical protein